MRSLFSARFLALAASTACATALLLSQTTLSVADPAPPATAPSTQPDSRPNVVVIVADDLGFGDLSIQGNKQVNTPNIDSIAKNGVRFTNGYVTGPYCSPTRAGLISGRYQERHGHDYNPDGNYNDGPEVGLSLDESTLADAFHSAGYRTACIGKWHLGVTPQLMPTSRGFDEFFGFLPALHDYIHGPPSPDFKSKIPGQHRGSLLRNTTVVEEKEYTTDAFGREGSAFIHRNQGKPFFLYFATNAVHTPLQATQKYLDRVAGIQDKQRKVYLAMVSGLDDAVGQVLTALRDTGAEDNTLIFFISDNGGVLRNGATNGPFRGQKMSLWEGGIHVPYFVQWKAKIPQGVDIENPVAQIDIFPTSIAAAGIPTPKNKQFDGVNFLALAEQQSTTDVHEQLFWRFAGTWAVRDHNWKLLKNNANATPQLFDLSTDLGEATDRSDEFPELVDQLTAEWQEWNKGNQDPRWVPPEFKKHPVPTFATTTTTDAATQPAEIPATEP